MTAPEPTASDPIASAGGNVTEQTILETGAEVSGGESPILVKLPGSGELQIGYSFTDEPAATAMLIHADSTNEQLMPGDNTYDSLPGDALFLSLAYSTQSIKLTWSYL